MSGMNKTWARNRWERKQAEKNGTAFWSGSKPPRTRGYHWHRCVQPGCETRYGCYVKHDCLKYCQKCLAVFAERRSGEQGELNFDPEPVYMYTFFPAIHPFAAYDLLTDKDDVIEPLTNAAVASNAIDSWLDSAGWPYSITLADVQTMKQIAAIDPAPKIPDDFIQIPQMFYPGDATV